MIAAGLVHALFDSSIVDAVGWSVMHFVWQGAAIAAIAAIALALMKRRSAEARYCVCAAALAAMFLAKAATLVSLLQTSLTAGSLLPTSHAAPIDPGFTGLLPWVAYLWIAGVIWQGSRTGWQWYRIQRLVWRAPRELLEPWRTMVPELARRVGVRAAVRVVETARVTVPATVGWLRPVLLLPVGLTTGLTTDEIALVIAHELAHIRRADFFVNLLQSLIEAVLFYHPLVWWVSRRMRTEREFCCDDLVVRTRGDAIGYARALTELESFRRRALSLSMAANGGSLMTRIQRIVSTRPASSQRRPGWLASVLLLGGLVGATSITAYGLSIHDNDDPPAAVAAVSDGPLLATFSAGVIQASTVDPVADVTDASQELLRIKRARLQRLIKEIAELEEQCGEPTIAQVTRASSPMVASIVTGRTTSQPRATRRGRVLDVDGRPVAAELVEIPAEDDVIHLDVKPVIRGRTVIDLAVQPISKAAGVRSRTTVRTTDDAAALETLGALGYEGSSAQETSEVHSRTAVRTTDEGSTLQALRALGYVGSDAQAGPDEIATAVRTTTTTESPSHDTVSAMRGTVSNFFEGQSPSAGMVVTSESTSGKTEIQRLSDEIDVLKKMIMDLNKKLDAKGKTD